MADPVALDDSYSITAGEQSKLGFNFTMFGRTFDISGLLKNDTDADGDVLQIESVEGQTLSNGEVTVTGSAGGEFRILADGSFYFDASTGFEDLAAGETRDTTVTYTVSDGNGGTSEATVTVTVTGIDGDELVAADDTYALGEQDSIIFEESLFTNDDSAGGLTLVAVNGEAIDSSVTSTVADGSNGGLFVLRHSDGAVAYFSLGHFNYLAQGETATTSFTYTVETSAGDQYTATATVTVSGDDDAPVLSQDEYTVTAGDGAQPLSEVSSLLVYNNGQYELVETDTRLLGNDVDPERGALELVSVDGIAFDGADSVTTASGITVSADGTVSFDASTGYEFLREGQTESLVVNYTVRDETGLESTSTLTVNVEGVDGDAVVTQDDTWTLSEHGSMTFFQDLVPHDNDNLDNAGAWTGEWISVSDPVLDSLLVDDSVPIELGDAFNYLAEGESAVIQASYRLTAETAKHRTRPYL